MANPNLGPNSDQVVIPETLLKRGSAATDVPISVSNANANPNTNPNPNPQHSPSTRRTLSLPASTASSISRRPRASSTAICSSNVPINFLSSSMYVPL